MPHQKGVLAQITRKSVASYDWVILLGETHKEKEKGDGGEGEGEGEGEGLRLHHFLSTEKAIEHLSTSKTMTEAYFYA